MIKGKDRKEDRQPNDPSMDRGRRNRFSPSQLRQALSAVMEAGLTVGSIEFDDRRSVRIIIGTQANKAHPRSEFELWEEKL